MDQARDISSFEMNDQTKVDYLLIKIKPAKTWTQLSFLFLVAILLLTGYPKFYQFLRKFLHHTKDGRIYKRLLFLL